MVIIFLKLIYLSIFNSAVISFLVVLSVIGTLYDTLVQYGICLCITKKGSAECVTSYPHANLVGNDELSLQQDQTHGIHQNGACLTSIEVSAVKGQDIKNSEPCKYKEDATGISRSQL